MIRLTTPKHKFTFPQNTDTYKKVVVTYKQGPQIVLEKKASRSSGSWSSGSDITFETETVNGVTKYIGWCKLSQAETKSFKDGIPVEIQIRVLDSNDNAYASEIFTVDVQRVLNTDILS